MFADPAEEISIGFMSSDVDFCKSLVVLAGIDTQLDKLALKRFSRSRERMNVFRSYTSSDVLSDVPGLA